MAAACFRRTLNLLLRWLRTTLMATSVDALVSVIVLMLVNLTCVMISFLQRLPSHTGCDEDICYRWQGRSKCHWYWSKLSLSFLPPSPSLSHTLFLDLPPPPLFPLTSRPHPSFHQDLGSSTVLCPSTGELCKGQCCKQVRGRAESDPLWYRPSSLEELAALYNANSDKKIKLIAGDTGRGESI